MSDTPSARKHSGAGRNLRYLLHRHLEAAQDSLVALLDAPLSTLLTAAVLAIALALPAGLHMVLSDMQRLTGHWQASAGVSVFLNLDTPPAEARLLVAELQQDPRILEAVLTSPEQALEDFRASSGFAEALELLQSNPLPYVITVTPSPEQRTPALMEALADELKARSAVELAQFDLRWLQRFHAMTEVAGRVVRVLALLLSLGVLLVVGNTIRLEIQGRREEIEVCKLVGATNGFIRRPFLYMGAWYGVIGGLLAWLFVALSLWQLSEPVARLAGLYSSDFRLGGTGFLTFGLLLAGGGLLGLLGAWVAVGRHLDRMDLERIRPA